VTTTDTVEVRRISVDPVRYGLFTPNGARLALPAISVDGVRLLGLTVPPETTPDVLRRPSTDSRLDGPHARVDVVYARDLTDGDYLPSPRNNDEFLRVTAVTASWRTGDVYYKVATVDGWKECLAWDSVYVLKEDLK
jgi:hypothetical protein